MGYVQHVIGKLGNMRKDVEWTVYPASRTANSDTPTLFVQSDKRAVRINLKTGIGWLSNGKGHPGFGSTTLFLGAKEIKVPQGFIDKALACQPKSGDIIGVSSGTGVVRIA